MTFASWAFAVYLLLVFSAYLFTPNRHRASLLLFASYLFYAWWDWHYILLLFASTVVDFLVALKLGSDSIHRKRWLWLSIVFNIGMLSWFKYLDFFTWNLNQLFEFGFDYSELVLPIGISFYTFQTLSYTIDVYRRRIEPERDFVIYATYVSFFPQLVAGPIERATRLLPQIKRLALPSVSNIRSGLTLITWGFFVKLVIADNMTPFISDVFSGEKQLSGLIYWLASVLIFIKVYADFLGYTEIARGTAKFFGVDLMANFRRPFLATNLRDFWQRWHISLTSWIGDYVHKPLSKKLAGHWARRFIVVLVMVIVGFWHGAGWNFIGYGFTQGVILLIWVPVAQSFAKRVKLNRLWNNVFGWTFTMLSIVVVAPMFLITDLTVLKDVLKTMFTMDGGATLAGIWNISGKLMLLFSLLGVCVLATVDVISEWKGRDVIQSLSSNHHRVGRWAFTLLLICVTCLLGRIESEPFVYFAF